MLSIENVCLAYGNTIIIDRFNLRVERGMLACISGQSGCGKTSILNAIMGFVPLRSGTITVEDLELSPDTADAIRRKIAWLPQELALPTRWVSEMVQMPFLLKANRGVEPSKEKVIERFACLGLDPELYSKRVSEISGGQRQRIMIAVASLLGKPILIVDEPTSALDCNSVDRVLNLFHKLTAGGMSILAVSHDKQFSAASDLSITL